MSLRFYPVTSGDGTRLNAWTNDVDGPTVLLCNGLGTNPYAWPALLDDRCSVRVVSWNRRGTGGSDRPADETRVGVDAFVEDALAVLDDAGIESCPVAGWSIGVKASFELATLFPERVTGLFAMAGVPGGTFASMLAPLMVPRFARRALTLNVARSLRTVGKAVTPVTSRVPVGSTSANAPPQRLHDEAGRQPRRQPGGGRVPHHRRRLVHGHLAVAAAEHAQVPLTGISVPTAFVAGRYDILASARDMATAAERIAQATYAELPGSHFIQMEHPDLVHAELVHLLSRIPATTTASTA